MPTTAIRGLICVTRVCVLTSLIFIYYRFNTKQIRPGEGKRGIDNLAVEKEGFSKVKKYNPQFMDES